MPSDGSIRHQEPDRSAAGGTPPELPREGRRRRAHALLGQMRTVRVAATEAYCRAEEAFIEAQHRHASGLSAGEERRVIADCTRELTIARAEVERLALELHHLHRGAGTR